MTTPYEQPASNSDHSNAPPEEHLQALQDGAKAALDTAKEHGTAQFEQYRDTAAEQIKSLAEGAKSAAEQMEGNDTLGLSHYVTDIAQNMTTLAENIRNKSAEQLLQQAGQLARDNPVLFLTGSVALGFGLSRFLRASDSSASSGTAAATTSTSGGRDTFQTHTSTAGEEAIAMTPSHTDDVFHSARPGVPDRSALAGGGAPRSEMGSFVPTDPLGTSATYPETHGADSSLSDGNDSQADGALPRDDLHKAGLARGDV